MAQVTVLMKNRELPTPQTLVNAIGQPEFLLGRYAISSALKKKGISERHQMCFYCLFINLLWPGNQQTKLNHGPGVDVEQ